MYTGVMVAWGCAVWGSGYYYPPYYGGFYGGYPMYYGRYPTYGYGASYNPWTGAYGRGAVAYGPYGGAGVGRATTRGPEPTRAAPPPRDPTARARRARPTTRAPARTAQTRQGSNVYGSWGSTRSSAATSGRHLAGDQPRDGHNDADDPGERRRRGGHPGGAGRHGAASRARAAATCTPAGTATSTATRAAAGRSTTTGTGASVDRPDHQPLGHPRATGRQAAPPPWTTSTATRGPRGRHAAHKRLQQLQLSGGPQQRQLLSVERERRSPRRRRGSPPLEPQVAGAGRRLDREEGRCRVWDRA